MRPPSRFRIGAAGLVTALVATVLGTAVLAIPAHAAPPVYVVAGDATGSYGEAWGFHDTYFAELRNAITNASSFGPSGTVQATFTIGAPRTLPITAPKLVGVDVYFLSARDPSAQEQQVLRDFVAQGGAVIANSNGPDLFDATSWLDLSLTGRVRFGDEPGDTTHRAPSPSSVVASSHRLANGPFGTVATFDNWHSVAGFSGAIPGGGTVISRTTLTGPDTIEGPPTTITLTNVPTVVTFGAGALFGSPGAGPVIATSDVDTFSNAYTVSPDRYVPGDNTNTLTNTGNGRLARNAFAWIAEQLASLRPAPDTAGFVPLSTPHRVLDSRTTGGAFGTGQSRVVSLAAAGVPADAELVAINLTAVDPSSAGYLTAWPTGIARPDVSSVNFTAGLTIANSALVRVGTGNSISVFNFSGNTHVLVDVSGYVAPSTGARFVNVTPDRLKDTRSGLGGTGIATAGATQSLRVGGTSSVPGNATAVVLNVTAVDPSATSFVTVWPDSPNEARPVVSNINTTAGTTLPNLVVARIPSSGNINLYNHSGTTHLVVDVLGYYVASNPTTGRISALSPQREVDTRKTATPLRQGEARDINVGITGASAVIVNVTAAEPTANGFLTVFPTDVGRPNASNLNFSAGRSVPNLVMVRPTADGRIRVFNSAGDTHVLIDVIARVDA